MLCVYSFSLDLSSLMINWIVDRSDPIRLVIIRIRFHYNVYHLAYCMSALYPADAPETTRSARPQLRCLESHASAASDWLAKLYTCNVDADLIIAPVHCLRSALRLLLVFVDVENDEAININQYPCGVNVSLGRARVCVCLCVVIVVIVRPSRRRRFTRLTKQWLLKSSL